MTPDESMALLDEHHPSLPEDQRAAFRVRFNDGWRYQGAHKGSPVIVTEECVKHSAVPLDRLYPLPKKGDDDA